MENGQFEVGPAVQSLPPVETPEPARPHRGAQPRTAEPIERKTDARPEAITPPKPETKEIAPPAIAAEIGKPVDVQPIVEPLPPDAGDGLRDAYDLLQRAASDLVRSKGSPIRDSDVKRRMLELRPGFDEGTYGFSKFSRFLRQAHDAEIINLQKVENGSYEVTPGARAGGTRAPRAEAEPRAARDTDGIEPRTGERPARRRGGRDRDRDRRGRSRNGEQEAGAIETPAAAAEVEAAAAPAKVEPLAQAAPAAPERIVRPSAPPPAPAPTPVAAPSPAAGTKPGVSLGFRRGSRGGSAAAAPPPILAGQTIQPAGQPAGAVPVKTAPHAPEAPQPEEKPRTRRPLKRAESARPRKDDKAPATAEVPSMPAAPTLDQLGLPSQEAGVIERLAGYKGVGRKSAEVAVQAFGAPAIFRVMHEQPERVRQTLGGRRAEQLLKGWQQDFAALTGAPAGDSAARKARPARPAADGSEAAPAARPARKTRRGGRKNARKKAGSTGK